MKRFVTSIVVIFSAICMMAQSQGWTANYGGVMLQGFYWDSFSDTSWKKLEKQANQFAGTFDLVWIPQSGYSGYNSMGYDDMYWFPGEGRYNSSFGAEIELRSMINTFKDKGIGTIADVVINHRKNVSSWFDFPKETYKGVTYEMTSTDICRNDDGGATYAEGQKQNPPVSLSQNDDTGEDWGGMRDLDHKSTNVQNIVKAYLDMLLNDFGYAGFRYDMVKGYAATYTQMYNESAQPQFSVGECWDSSNTIKNWIDGTGKTSAAFDFQFRYTVRNAANNGDWSKLAKQNDGNWPLISDKFENGAYRQWAVTFVENHDTEKRPNAEQDPIKKDTLAANAYLLAMPGTPCVFYTHWKAYPKQIKQMVHVRKFAGITNTNVSVQNVISEKNRAVRYVKIDNQHLLCVAVGSGAFSPNAALYQQVLSGYHFKYFLAKRLEKPFVDMPSGEYEESFKATMYALSEQSGASLVYTTDGSDPTASSTQASNGTEITISQNCTLKVGLLVGTEVSAIQTYTYTFKEEEKVEIPSFCTVEENEICAFFEAPASWTGTVKCWAWSESPEDNFTGGSWPGATCTLLGESNNGNKVWKWTWDGTKQKSSSATQPQKIIFSNSGSPQTDNYGFATGGYYDDEKLLAVVTPTGIEAIAVDAKTIETNSKVYTLDGRLLNTTGSLDGLRKGIYIVGGKKVIK